MPALERALDTLFGDIDDLLSDHQKSNTSFLSYDGEVITKPPEYKDRAPQMYDMIHKFTLMYPGITITDTEFIQSGYFSFQFPSIGPFKQVEVHIQPEIDDEKQYQLVIQWDGYSQSAGRFDLRYDIGASDFDDQFARILGRLFITCFNGLCVYNNLERYVHYFPALSCKNIEEKSSLQSSYEEWTGALDRLSVTWARVANDTIRVAQNLSSPEPEFPHTPQDEYKVGDEVILQTPYSQLPVVVKNVHKHNRKIKNYQVFYKSSGAHFTVPAEPRSDSRYYILGQYEPTT